MPRSSSLEQSFHAKIDGTEQGRVYILLPFNPEKVWGPRERYHITGTIGGNMIRGPLQKFAKGYFISLGPAYRRDNGLQPGETVNVRLMPEGPQREAIAADIAAALESEPQAGRFFDALATFYRKNYLRWIEATKRKPDVRAQRIAEFVRLMKAGVKQRPR